MRRLTPSRLLLSAAAIFSLFNLVTGTANADTTITLDQPVHFTTAEGSDVVLDAGDYGVKPAEEWLRVTPSGGNPVDAILLEAQAKSHGESLTEPFVLSVDGETNDSHHLIMLLPGGKQLEAVGSYSGIRSRATRSLSKAKRLAALKAAQARGKRARSSIKKPLVKSSALAPTVTSFSPRRKMMVGEVITFRGTNLRPADFIAQLGQTRPVILPHQRRRASSTSISVVVPAGAVTPNSPLIVKYKGGAIKTLESNFRVFPRPRFGSMRIIEGPWIGQESRIELTISNFVGLENARVTLRSRSCWTQGRLDSPRLPGRAGTARLVFPIIFRPSGSVANLPGNNDTERLVALSGRTCPLELSFSQPLSATIPTGKTVKLPRVSAKTISSTWDLMNYTTPSGKKFGATADPPITCSPVSIGTAGTFAIGVVKSNNDLSFQIRNGITHVSCLFKTTQKLTTKAGWVITEADWNFQENDFCRIAAGVPHFEISSGSFGLNPPHDGSNLRRIKMRAQCGVDKNDRPNNRHRFLATLRNVTLVGPVGETWRQAFR